MGSRQERDGTSELVEGKVLLPEPPNSYSSIGLNDDSGVTLFHHSRKWMGDTSAKEERHGFIEPIGYVTRVNGREGMLGETWFAGDHVAMNSKQDLVKDLSMPVDSSVKGIIRWCAEGNLGSYRAEDDRLCALLPNDDGTIKQLSPFRSNSSEIGCYVYACTENKFITHAPYMAIVAGELKYDILVAIQDDEWATADLTKWWMGPSLLKPLNFGNFRPVQVKLIVPCEALMVWEDRFAEPLSKWFAGVIDKVKGTDVNLLAKVSLRLGKLQVSIDCLNESVSFVQTLPNPGQCWPLHIMNNRILISGAPSFRELKPSLFPEIRSLQEEVAGYRSQLAQVEQAKTSGIWCLEKAIAMYTAQRTGHASESSSFIVYKVDYTKVFRPTPNPIREDLSKGSGLPLLIGNPYYDELCQRLCLKGLSQSPMAVANTLQYSRFVYGKDMGTPLGLADALFLYDYGGDWTMPAARQWIAGLGNIIAQVHDVGASQDKCLLECNVLNYEFVRAKKRYEDTMRRSGVRLSHICAWKDLRELLHFRYVDGAFIKLTMTSSLDNEAYYVVGFATIPHDVCDYGYDLSVCECSSLLYTLGAVDGSYDSLEFAYAVVVAGIQYVAKVHRNTAPGLTFASTHYWQLCNGRHRFLNCAMSVAEHKHPRVLDVKESLLDTILNRKFSKGQTEPPAHDHQQCVKIYTDLKIRCEKNGKPFETLLRTLVARPYQRIFGKALDKTGGLDEVDAIISILECVCLYSSNDGIDLLWDIALFMWSESAIMWHSLLGSLLVISDRLVGDDTAGYGYESRLWE